MKRNLAEGNKKRRLKPAVSPTCDKDEVLNAFKSEGKYGKAFLESLERGLERSLYFK